MNSLAKLVTVAACLGMTSHPCLAAVNEAPSATQMAPLATSTATHAQFDLKRHGSNAALTSMSIAASQQTAAEMEDQPKRKGPETTTWLVVGGLVLVAVLVAVVVSSVAPSPGPSKGAFD